MTTMSITKAKMNFADMQGLESQRGQTYPGLGRRTQGDQGDWRHLSTAWRVGSEQTEIRMSLLAGEDA